MTLLAFLAIVLTYGLITLYFCWRYVLRRRLPSLVCAFMPIGWIAAFGLQLEHIHRRWLPLLFASGFIVALVSLGIITSHELKREHPFR